jgi:hypothetical protein
MWIDDSVLTDASEPGPRKRGQPYIYADAVIQMLPGLKQVFGLPLRALQGFAQRLCELAFICHAAIATCSAEPSIPTRERAAPWPASTSGARSRNDAIAAIEQRGRPQLKKCSGYQRRSLVENLMYRLKMLTGNSLWAGHIRSQVTEVAIRGGVLNPMALLARPQSVRIA